MDPDGHTIATMERSPEGWRPIAFDVDTGSRQIIANDILFERLGGIAWLQRAMVCLLLDFPGGDTNLQIWRLSTNEGTLKRITNDPNNYFPSVYRPTVKRLPQFLCNVSGISMSLRLTNRTTSVS